MDSIKKQNIANQLRTYCERYESQNKAANSLTDVSSATISQMLNEKWSLIKDDMWRNVSAQIGYKDEKWEPVMIGDFRRMHKLLDDAKENSLVMAVTGEAGSGKTFAIRHYTESHKQVYMLCCSDFWNKRLFLNELLSEMGKDSGGYTIGEMMSEVVRILKVQEKPLLILDEADKLSDVVLYFFITIYNQLEDECGIVLCATNHLEKRLKRGVKLNKKGYKEIWSRLGRKCIELKGVTSADVTAICEANGVEARGDIDSIISDSESDLRRVKRRIHATKKRAGKSITD